MRDLAFYNVGCHEPRGMRRVVIYVRRALRRVLRPIFQRQVEILTSLCDRLDADELATHDLRVQVAALQGRQDRIVEQVQMSVALGWDHVAMARRLAALEDRVEALMAESGAGGDAASSIQFPRPAGDVYAADEARAKVC